MDENMMKHMELSPARTPTHADSVRATAVAADLKRAIAKYAGHRRAIADGYKMFLPNVKEQHVYHFTNNRHALGAVFRFDATKPTSVLYKRGDDGTLHLVGAMYTMPKNASLDVSTTASRSASRAGTSTSIGVCRKRATKRAGSNRRTASLSSVRRAPSPRKRNATRRTGTFIRASSAG